MTKITGHALKVIAAQALPCPFCGGPASIEQKEYGVIELGCDNVGCSVLPSTTRLSMEEAAKSWNRRIEASSVLSTKEPTHD